MPPSYPATATLTRRDGGLATAQPESPDAPPRERTINTATEEIRECVETGAGRAPPERQGGCRAEHRAGQDVAGKVNAERDSANGENGCGNQGKDSPLPLAQQDRHRDCEGCRRVVAGKAGVGSVRGEEVDAVGVGDEGTSPVDQFGDQLARREGEAGAEDSGDCGPPAGQTAGAARKEEDEKQGRGEKRLGDFDEEEKRVLEAVVAHHEVVEAVKQRPIHCHDLLHS